jgi:urease accessory protein
MKDLIKSSEKDQPRTIGALDLRVRGTGQLRHLYQQGASKALFARKRVGTEAIFINTSGGITGGDQLDGYFETSDTACLSVTTQGCERIYRSRSGKNGTVHNRLAVRDQSALFWLPQETLFYDGGHLERRLSIDVSSEASALIVEPMLFGRLAMGEHHLSGNLQDCVTLSIDGQLTFQDATHFWGNITETLDRPAVMAGARATALVVFSSQIAGAVLPKIRLLLNDTSGASLVQDHILIARLIAADGMALRRMLIPIIAEITQTDLPKTWRL